MLYAGTRSRRTNAWWVLGLVLLVSLGVGCPQPKPPPIKIERTPFRPDPSGTLAGTMNLVAGPIDLTMVPITPAMSQSKGIAVPRREYTGWLVTMHNRSSRTLRLNPRYDRWLAITESGEKLVSTPGTRLRLSWFMDAISVAAADRVKYPDWVEAGEMVEFPVYVPETSERIDAVRFYSRHLQGEAELVDPGLQPTPLELAGRARVEALQGEAQVLVGFDRVSNPLGVGSVVRSDDIVVLGDDTVIVLVDEWGTGHSYQLTGPDRFRLVPPPDR